MKEHIFCWLFLNACIHITTSNQSNWYTMVAFILSLRMYGLSRQEWRLRSRTHFEKSEAILNFMYLSPAVITLISFIFQLFQLHTGCPEIICPLFIWPWYHRALTEQAEIHLDRASGYPQLSVGHMIHPGHMTLTPVRRQWPAALKHLPTSFQHSP